MKIPFRAFTGAHALQQSPLQTQRTQRRRARPTMGLDSGDDFTRR